MAYPFFYMKRNKNLCSSIKNRREMLGVFNLFCIFAINREGMSPFLLIYEI